MNVRTATALQLDTGSIGDYFSEADMSTTVDPTPYNVDKRTETRHFTRAPRTTPILDESVRAVLNQKSLWKQRLFMRLPFPRRWEAEGIDRPNMAAKIESFSIIQKLLEEYQLIPISIAASIEEGICITYNNVTGWQDKSLIIEVYNDLEIALIVTDNKKKKTIYGADVRNSDFETAVEIYQNYR